MKELEYPLDGNFIISKKRRIKRKLQQDLDKTNVVSMKIAILGGSTTNEVKDCLELFLLNVGIVAEFYESEYNRFFEDAVFENEELRKFSPDIVYIHTSNRNIYEWPELTETYERVEQKLQKVYEHFEQVWEHLNQKFQCVIIQNNMELPYYRIMGNTEASDYHGKINFIERLNQRFYQYANTHKNFLINDIHYLSAYYGLEKWSEPFYWYMYKYSLNVAAIPVLAQNIANIIKAIYGMNKKAIVVDLDNTLWGGVIGEDGVDKIEIGQETPTGQAYYDFQEYIKKHKDMGILLNVCSKNDMENAILGLNHVDSVLKQDDFLVIKANWEPKSTNIIKVSEQLNILPNSIVFIDDSPAEREIVRQQVSSVAVPELSRIENYIKEIDNNGYFEVFKLSMDDINRNNMYKSNIERMKESQKYDNYEDYLRSLEMHAKIKSFEQLDISRVAQLVNKSNQFNMTAKRYTEAEINEIAKDNRYITLCGRLTDKFGDNGVVSIIIGKVDNNVCHVELWLMSCRVLKRDMEFAMLDTLINECKKREVLEIKGYYYPTGKNKMVAEFYCEQGFEKVEKDSKGNTIWKWDMSNMYINKNLVIKVED